MIAARRLAVARSCTALVQRRSAQTVPRFGSEEAMKKDAIEQLRARLAYQKEIESAKHSGHSHADEVNEMWKWIRISFMIAFPICCVSVVKDLVLGEHHHHDDGPLPDYMKIRNKAFPWECGDCSLFDQKCWNACKAEKRAGH